MYLTCKLFNSVKSQANTIVFLFTANSPMIQVSPSKGRSTTVPLTAVLKKNKQLSKLKNGEVSITEFHFYRKILDKHQI